MNLVKEKNTRKKTHITNEFKIDDFLRALDKVIELNDNNIQFYTLENSIRVLHYPRSFRSDFNALASIYRGTRKDGKYLYLEQFLTAEVVAKLQTIIDVKSNSKVRFAKRSKHPKVKAKRTALDIDEFIKAWRYFLEIKREVADCLYTDFDKELSWELLEYNRAFANDYEYFAEIALNSKGDRKIIGIAKPFDNEECRRKLGEANFFILPAYKRKKNIRKKDLEQ